MANAKTSTAAPAAPEEGVNIGALITSMVAERLNEEEAAEAAAEGRAPEELDVEGELSRASVVKFLTTTDGQVWRRDKAAPNIKSGAYQILAMFRYNELFPIKDDDGETTHVSAYAGVHIYLIPTKPDGSEEPVLLRYDMRKSKIDFIADEFRDVESFAGAVAGEILASLGVDDGEDDEDDEKPEEQPAGQPAVANGGGAQVTS